jgi:hypothetical protein
MSIVVGPFGWLVHIQKQNFNESIINVHDDYCRQSIRIRLVVTFQKQNFKIDPLLCQVKNPHPAPFTLTIPVFDVPRNE